MEKHTEKRVEKIKTPRERLLELEKTGKYLFHGSPVKIETLEPRQPREWNLKTKRIEEEGPCISATPYARVAMFRAIVNKKNFPADDYDCSFGAKADEDGYEPTFEATRYIIDGLKGKNGFVYVLEKSKFKPRDKDNNFEWRAVETVTPIECIAITDEDIQDKVNIIELDDLNKEY